jgi:lipopolysaccharide biosynthesis regulator YciM
LLEQHSGYACRRCGFKAKSLHWQCPSCKRWATIKPVIDAESEPAGA